MTYRPGTTSPQRRLANKIDSVLNKAGKDPKKKPNTKPKSGSKADRERAKDPKPELHRRKKPKKKETDKEAKMEIDKNIKEAVKHLIKHHKNVIHESIEGFENKKLLSKVALKFMSTCLPGWKESEEGLVSENTNMVLSKNSWTIAEDGSAKLTNGFKFDYDWLYDIANNKYDKEIIKEEISKIADKDMFADTLTNAAGMLKRLSDKEVIKYILSAAKKDEDIDITNLKKILEDTGVNWEFVGAEIQNDNINLYIRVKYSVDGTQRGVVEKKLGIEVKPSADVMETDTSESVDDDDRVDLSFNKEAEKDEDIEDTEDTEEEPEDEDISAALDY